MAMAKAMANKFLVTVGLLILVMVFALQNSAIVEIRLLFWEVSFPRSLLIFMMLTIGIIVGWFARSIYRISRNGD